MVQSLYCKIICTWFSNMHFLRRLWCPQKKNHHGHTGPRVTFSGHPVLKFQIVPGMSGPGCFWLDLGSHDLQDFLGIRNLTKLQQLILDSLPRLTFGPKKNLWGCWLLNPVDHYHFFLFGWDLSTDGNPLKESLLPLGSPPPSSYISNTRTRLRCVQWL